MQPFTSQDNIAPKAWNTITILRRGISILLDLIFTTEGAVLPAFHESFIIGKDETGFRQNR